ncbi:hypothetical protein IPZ61_15695 [Streptomyces sioyaensis]|uniref:hypothetical protein n=1 Tax=Streptomyces sioyaensis TaxID=67364 RepID=UPI001F2F40E9|nr:hypothetical protein [Streptomyces sioyaensis]MCF3174761.1 hypothetical protein [Streptomyces sioyaensis]
MTEPKDHMRRLPWNSPAGAADYAPHGVVDHIADRTETDIINRARNDAAYALVMTQRPEASREELCRLVAKLAGHVRDVSSVADMREERLNSPAAKALEGALRAALGQH